jgi:AcrR family transcriptional regulator
VTAAPTPAGREPGLRERKKAETRQRISDLATGMFLDQGFDAVRVADIAARAGVSEKTVFNYFPAKESLVFDQADQQLAAALAAVTERPSGASPVRAYVEQLRAQMTVLIEDDFGHVREIVPRFGEMLESTPTLRAAWGDHRHRMVDAVAHALAEDLDVDALDPEPRTVARALVSLTELSYDSVLRHILLAQSGEDLLERVEADLDRGARLLDTGIWSRHAPGVTSDQAE